MAKVNPKFVAWLKHSKWNVASLSYYLCRAESTLYGYRNGHTTPSLDVATRIADISRGKVPAGSWR